MSVYPPEAAPAVPEGVLASLPLPPTNWLASGPTHVTAQGLRKALLQDRKRWPPFVSTCIRGNGAGGLFQIFPAGAPSHYLSGTQALVYAVVVRCRL